MLCKVNWSNNTAILAGNISINNNGNDQSDFLTAYPTNDFSFGDVSNVQALNKNGTGFQPQNLANDNGSISINGLNYAGNSGWYFTNGNGGDVIVPINHK